jgi:spermidine/putrescine transport system substrate-binding protein
MMRTMVKIAAATSALLALSGAAHAEGVLNLYNWGDYTSPR